ncbi:MAG: ABC transporter substrate-binding protein [Rhizobiales bacterium]|nr:ABC transporter substrate-binding protein [Hyphomicrobiales bacterium]
MHGEPAMPEGFTHFRYVNPAAPKGGRLVQGVLGSFDTLNPFIVKGLPPIGLRAPGGIFIIGGYVVESLMVRGYDEPFTLYGLIARRTATDKARTFATFELDPAARFSDGKPITPEDVLFSWQLLRDKGRPNHRIYYSKVIKAQAIGLNSVRFDLPGDDRELPLILGLMPVLPKHAIDPATFEETTIKPMIGSGPYLIGKVDPGRSLTLVRNPNYWGRDLAVNRGFWNFDEIRYDFYRDPNALHEAFKRGLIDVRKETDPARWMQGYDFPAMRDGQVVKETFSSDLPKPSFYFVFNTRRAVFADVRVREAIATLFDFEWTNKNIFFGLYRRTASYFEDSELSAHGRPADARERALLAPFPGAVRADILDGTWSPPVSDGSGRDRATLRRALRLFAQAGYELRGTELVERKSGRPLTFEIMVTARSDAMDEERMALLFASQLKRAGVTVRVRPVDAVQFEARRITFDFDMISNRWDESLSPGNEQAFYWSSEAADSNGSRNYMGVKSPAVDATIEALLKAHDRAEVVAAVRALDRVLMSGFYTVPLFYPPDQWIARWTKVRHPEVTSRSGPIPETWWLEPQ